MSNLEPCEAWAGARQQPINDFADASIDEGHDGGWVVGLFHLPINFCPWCGTPLPDERHE